MFSYVTAKRDEKTFMSLTSLNLSEFKDLCESFSKQWDKVCRKTNKDPKKGGRPHILKTMEDRLFFILFYLKTYPLQEVIAYCFGMNQGTANMQIHLLSHVLRLTLKERGHTPARMTREMISRLAQEEVQTCAIDATERRIIRPMDNQVQETFYSGKKNAIP